MDPVKNQISAVDPLAIDPEAEPNGEDALHKILSGTTVFRHSPPGAGVTSLDNHRHRKAQIAGGFLLAAAAVTAAVLVGANFGSVSSKPAPAATVTSAQATPTASATPSATPSVSASVPAANPAPAQTAPAAAPTTAPSQPAAQAVALQTFTFPDGHVSFQYPAGWSVRTEQGPYLSEETKASSMGAIVSDAAGGEVAHVFSGFYGDGTGGWVKRTVLDSAAVPGITDKSGNPLKFGFASDQGLADPAEGMATPAQPADSRPSYFMDVRLSSEFEAGERSSGTNQIMMPNGAMSARVLFDFEKQPIFASPETAKAWMNSVQYTQLKALLLSLRYQ
ncbi:hypothetical protein F8G81_04610 [Arthrobacter sp. CDRTa11]|uniref:hypothetical protein n=1 Tax=Arthrobacter sp. CDRTa11 TaxID=2651199 RepID=UPI0022659533|nr:hypothetical protein [Arthrobacter sp. CDRTa11]UZX01982.1 hypothetical protein F8G81_04610 [Arthrobacter sp. CDRTa11]